MIFFFKHIIHVDDFPMNGHPPSELILLDRLHYMIGELFTKVSVWCKTHLPNNSNITAITRPVSCTTPMLAIVEGQ